MTNTFLPLLEAPSNPADTSGQVGSSTVINISSLLGSCEGSGRFSTTSYQCSKVAVNMLTKCQAAASPTIKFIAIHPGWVSKVIMSMVNFNLVVFFRKTIIVTILGIRTSHLQVQTDMGSAKNRSPPVTVKDSANGIIDTASNLPLEQSGSFFSWQGKKIPY